MAGESPLGMMQPRHQQVPRRSASRSRRVWPVLAPVAVVILLAIAWCWLWYYAAAVADRTLAGWVDREAAAGRAYSCGTQGLGGFPFRIEVSCIDAVADLHDNKPPLSVRAKDITFDAAVYHPTVLVGAITAPLTVAAAGEPTSFAANWSLARITVDGLPPEPERVYVTIDRPRIDRLTGSTSETAFTADHADLDARIVGGSASNNPVVDVVLRFKAAAAPSLNPALADPLQGSGEVVLRGFKNLLPKPFAERFREMQAAGGNIEFKSLRLERSDAIIVGSGTLTVNDHGRLDGLIRLAIAGLERIVPQLGVERWIGQGLDRLGGNPGTGLNALDRLMPGLGGAIRESANANLIENLKKMGQPTEIDKKPAIVLPLRIADGSLYLGMLPLGQLPPLF